MSTLFHEQYIGNFPNALVGVADFKNPSIFAGEKLLADLTGAPFGGYHSNHALTAGIAGDAPGDRIVTFDVNFHGSWPMPFDHPLKFDLVLQGDNNIGSPVEDYWHHEVIYTPSGPAHGAFSAKIYSSATVAGPPATKVVTLAGLSDINLLNFPDVFSLGFWRFRFQFRYEGNVVYFSAWRDDVIGHPSFVDQISKNVDDSALPIDFLGPSAKTDAILIVDCGTPGPNPNPPIFLEVDNIGVITQVPPFSAAFVETFQLDQLNLFADTAPPTQFRDFVGERMRTFVLTMFNMLRFQLTSIAPPITPDTDFEHEISFEIEFQGLVNLLTGPHTIALNVSGSDPTVFGWLYNVELDTAGGAWGGSGVMLIAKPIGPAFSISDILDPTVFSVNAVNFPTPLSAENINFLVKIKHEAPVAGAYPVTFSIQALDGTGRYLVDPTTVDKKLNQVTDNDAYGPLADGGMVIEVPSGKLVMGGPLYYTIDNIAIDRAAPIPPIPPLPPFPQPETYKISPAVPKTKAYFGEGSSPGLFQATCSQQIVPVILGYQPFGRPVFQTSASSKELDLAGDGFSGFLGTTVMTMDEKYSFEERAAYKALNAVFHDEVVTLFTGHGPVIVSDGQELDPTRQLLDASITNALARGTLIKFLNGKYTVASPGDTVWAEYIDEHRPDEFMFKIFQNSFIAP